MFRINELPALAKAIGDDKSVHLTRRGVWKEHRGFFLGLERLFGLHARHTISLAKRFVEALDALESVPVRFASSEQAVDYTGYLEVGRALVEKLTEQHATELLAHLQDRLVGLSYRIETANGGETAGDVDQGILNHLVERAVDWKQHQTAFADSSLDAADHSRLAEVSRYPAFVQLLLSNSALIDAFFLWTLRDRVDVAVFVQYPALRERLFNSYLTPRIGRFGGNLVRIQKVAQEQSLRKIVTLPFEGQEVNILDSQRTVTFRGNYRMTIKQIFAVFAAKMQRVGDLEFFSNGIANWNSHLLGWWDADRREYHLVDVNRPAWWKELPFLETMTVEKAKEIYGDHLNGTEWTLAVNATRTTHTLSPDASHAFIELVVPMVDGMYAIYAMGKFATTYAGSMFDSLKLFTATLKATVAYPDENIFYTHRQHVRRSFALSAVEGMRYFESIRKDILRARAGSLTYQVESENCAKWIQDKMEELLGAQRVGNLFRIAMLDTEPPGAALTLFSFLRQLPSDWHSPVLSVLHYIIGAWRGIWIEEGSQKVWVSVTTTQFWNDKVCYVPAVLHQQQLQPMLLAQAPVPVISTTPPTFSPGLQVAPSLAR
jgi:hypothetical protein